MISHMTSLGSGKIKGSGILVRSPIYGAGGRDFHPRFASGKSGIGLSMALPSPSAHQSPGQVSKGNRDASEVS